jgi:septal ring factor EnvC (AmiA/AmiB activator)
LFVVGLVFFPFVPPPHTHIFVSASAAATLAQEAAHADIDALRERVAALTSERDRLEASLAEQVAALDKASRRVNAAENLRDDTARDLAIAKAKVTEAIAERDDAVEQF